MMVTKKEAGEAVRAAKARLGVNKHHGLEGAAQLHAVLPELTGLTRDGTVPPDAATYPSP